MQRLARLQYIQRLDPERDTCEICRLFAGYEFPWDVNRALEIALFRTFCAPSISQLLDRTGEFQHRPQKRYDDTGLLISQILKWGYDSDRGQAALQRMNRIHAHFAIANADYLYVLSTFIYEPLRWLDRFGWRSPCEVERQALFHFWQRVGQDMGIQNIPATSAELEAYNRAYEAEQFRYSPASQRVGTATLNLMLSWFPAPLRPALRPLVFAMLDERLLEAFGFPSPSDRQRQLVARLLRWRGRSLRHWPPRRQPQFYADGQHRSYPQGYTLTDIGPPELLPTLNRSPD